MVIESKPTSGVRRFTTADLEAIPERWDGTRYEIIDGDLYVSKQVDWHHQHICGVTYAELLAWSIATGLGQPIFAPGVIFADDDNVIPDLVWVSAARLPLMLSGAGGHLHHAPDLVVEALSPGPNNDRRDREVKLKLYSRRGVLEYWIPDWQTRTVEVYRRENLALHLIATLREGDSLESPLLPGFVLPLARLFAPLI